MSLLAKILVEQAKLHLFLGVIGLANFDKRIKLTLLTLTINTNRSISDNSHIITIKMLICQHKLLFGMGLITINQFDSPTASCDFLSAHKVK